ncbi:TonB-dependent siderophore receptor [Sphingobacterium sp. LRF_L2]|uniref:TonB-dependent siderophore receptor n=1 Tax=Sphingobacterium sp. LRF_L2 TaxID=3369421 RepID=UPI003F5EA360
MQTKIKRIRITLFLLVLSIYLPLYGYSQSSILKERVSLEANNMTLEQVIQHLEKTLNINFSYFSDQIDLHKKVDVKLSNTPLDIVLRDVLSLTSESYQVDGRHISIRLQGTASLQGYITTQDGIPAAYSTVAIASGKSTMADKDGHYMIKDITAGEHVLHVKLLGADLERQKITLKEGKNRQDFVFSVSSQHLSEVVVVGNKYQVSAKKQSEDVARINLPYIQNPQVYSVVDKELIKEQLAVSLDEAFRNVPGAAPSKTGAGMPAFFSRGFQTSENFRNGMATYLRTGIDLANVERVEAIKGPSSTFFGAQMTSFGGIINYITKKPHEDFTGEVSYSSGSWNFNRITADLNTALDKQKDVLFRINVAHQRENTFQYQGGNNSVLLAPSLSYKVNDRLTLSLDADYATQRGITPGGWFISSSLNEKSFKELNLSYRESLNDNSLTSDQQSTNILFQANYKIADRWLSETKYAWGNGAYDDLYIFDFIWRTTDSVDRILRSFTNENTARHNLQQNFKGDFKIGSSRHQLVAGIDWVQNFRYTRYDGLGYGAKVFESVDLTQLSAAPVIRIEEVQQILSTRNTGYNQTTQKTFGTYVSDVISLADRVHISLGIRFDRFINDGTYNTLSRSTTGDYTQNTLSPRLGFSFELLPEKLSLFGNYINGFKNIGNQIQPDQSISVFKAQRANQMEGGTKIAFGKLLNATLTYYNIEVSNSVMNRLVDNMNFYFQEGEQKSEGFEAELSSNPLPGLNILSSYGYNHNKFLKANASIEGKRALGTPEHVVNLWATYALLKGDMKGLGLGAGYTYVSDAYLDASNKFILDGYNLVDATLYYNHPKFRISLKGNNLLDVQYWVSDGYYARPQRPANFLASLTYRF